MPSLSKRASRLVCVIAFAALCLIGWVAQATRAQAPAENTASPQFPGVTATAPPLLQDHPDKAVASKPSSSADLGQPPIQEQIAPSVAASHEESQPAPDSSKAAASPPTLIADSLTPNPAEDPEKAALAFVEQNQKQAESQLKNLKDEEANLRARLRKVEAGIKRWESLLGALKQSQVLAVAPTSPVDNPKPPVDKK